MGTSKPTGLIEKPAQLREYGSFAAVGKVLFVQELE